MTPPKKGLKIRPYSMDMNKDIATLPKKGLKTRPYNIGMEKMEKKDLKKLTKGQLIKLLMNQRKDPTPPPRTGKWKIVKPKPIPCARVLMKTSYYHCQNNSKMGTSLFQSQGLTDHFKYLS